METKSCSALPEAAKENKPSLKTISFQLDSVDAVLNFVERLTGRRDFPFSEISMEYMELLALTSDGAMYFLEDLNNYSESNDESKKEYQAVMSDLEKKKGAVLKEKRTLLLKVLNALDFVPFEGNQYLVLQDNFVRDLPILSMNSISKAFIEMVLLAIKEEKKLQDALNRSVNESDKAHLVPLKTSIHGKIELLKNLHGYLNKSFGEQQVKKMTKELDGFAKQGNEVLSRIQRRKDNAVWEQFFSRFMSVIIPAVSIVALVLLVLFFHVIIPVLFLIAIGLGVAVLYDSFGEYDSDKALMAHLRDIRTGSNIMQKVVSLLDKMDHIKLAEGVKHLLDDNKDLLSIDTTIEEESASEKHGFKSKSEGVLEESKKQKPVSSAASSGGFFSLASLCQTAFFRNKDTGTSCQNQEVPAPSCNP